MLSMREHSERTSSEEVDVSDWGSYGVRKGSLWVSKSGFPQPGEWTANAMVPDIHAPSAERSEYGTYKCRGAY
jgi:hypothetical protein